MTQLNRKCLLASAFAISAAIVLAVSLSTIGCMDGDDWTISCMLSGKYENSTLCLFVNALLSQFILMLGAAMPDVNWFFVFERGVVWLSLSLIVYSAFLSGRRFSMQWTILAIYVVLLLPGCLLGSNYTFVAAASAISGELWILQALFSQNTVSNSRALTVLSGALIIVGCLMRLGAMLLTLPFFGLAFVCLSRKYKKSLKQGKWSGLRLFLRCWVQCALFPFSTMEYFGMPTNSSKNGICTTLREGNCPIFQRQNIAR